MILLTCLRRLAAATGGASAIEFALIMAVLMVPLTLGVYDFGTALYRWMQVGNAARAGATFVNVNGYSSAYTTSGNSCIVAANTFTCAVNQATTLGNSVTASVGAAYCGCQNGSTYNSASFSPPCNVCNATYTSNCCPSGQTPVTLTQVTATYTYKPAFNYLGFGPANGFNLSAQATALIY